MENHSQTHLPHLKLAASRNSMMPQADVAKTLRTWERVKLVNKSELNLRSDRFSTLLGLKTTENLLRANDTTKYQGEFETRTISPYFAQ